ncbi:hypothetical protein MRB53_038768 [Persea americana]|nr:hypothetical protein MRB53_038768 [Persea americana]
MDAAIEYALHSYKPDIKHDLGSTVPKAKQNKSTQGSPAPLTHAKQQKSKPPSYEYFSILDPSQSSFYYGLRHANRVGSPDFHVTLIHRANSKQYAGLLAVSDGDCPAPAAVDADDEWERCVVARTARTRTGAAREDCVGWSCHGGDGHGAWTRRSTASSRPIAFHTSPSGLRATTLSRKRATISCRRGPALRAVLLVQEVAFSTPVVLDGTVKAIESR